MDKTIVELFAGVGGFRIGFEKANSSYKTVWANQWEPKKNKQHAFECYKKHFEKNGGLNQFSNIDIATVDEKLIPNHTILVGGFPCQDYSVASTGAKGIQGKKGVLWWEINRILKEKRPPFLLLENVDRLLKSPSNQRGRDFGVILGCLHDMGYGVEWRVINAAEYGFTQRRKRVFIFGFHKSTSYFKQIVKSSNQEVVYNKGMFSKQFPVKKSAKPNTKSTILLNDIQDISDNFNFSFNNSGYMINGDIFSEETVEDNRDILMSTLGSILENEVSNDYYIPDEELPSWEYLKGGKAIERTSKEGHKYVFREGSIAYPDYLDRPARTMLTSEASKNRSTHVILDSQKGKLRKLTPIECERINGFDDNWTIEIPNNMRYFCMGNALVVGVITKIALEIFNIIEEE